MPFWLLLLLNYLRDETLTGRLKGQRSRPRFLGLQVLAGSSCPLSTPRVLVYMCGHPAHIRASISLHTGPYTAWTCVYMLGGIDVACEGSVCAQHCLFYACVLAQMCALGVLELAHSSTLLYLS